MVLRKWDDLPERMRNESVRKYYDILSNKKISLLNKRIFDIIVGLVTLIILLPVFFVISIAVKFGSEGPVFFRQVRVTQYARQFKILKFRTMVNNAESIGTQLTTNNDRKITKVGGFLRKYRLDEIPQLINIIRGDMSFVGTRPEVVKYVEKYTDEMMATLLLPAGVTSEASIIFKNEELLLADTEHTDEIYVSQILPEKMRYNLRSIEEFGFFNDIKTMIKTVVAIFQKDNAYDKDSIYNTDYFKRR